MLVCTCRLHATGDVPLSRRYYSRRSCGDAAKPLLSCAGQLGVSILPAGIVQVD